MTKSTRQTDQAIILAGGLGTRLRSVVTEVPKPMAPVGGAPFLEHLILFWMGQGVKRFILSVGYKWETIRQHFGAEYRGAEIEYAVEETPVGTGGGLCLALEYLKPSEHFFILNGDTFFGVDAAALSQFHLANSADLTLALHSVPENSRYGGVEIDGNGRVHSFSAEGGRNMRLINGGVYLARRDLLAGAGIPRPITQPISLESGLFAKMLNEGRRFFGWESQSTFIDIGIPTDYDRAQQLLTSLA